MSAESMQVSEESVYDIFACIRRRRGLHAPEPSLVRLEAYLYGYIHGLRARGFDLRDMDNFGKFSKWVAGRLGVPDSDYWLRTILKSTSSDEDAFFRFFELLDEFQKENP
jgi:hypothetical protein